MNPKNIKLKDCWKKLDFEWRKQIYLNYRLSKEDIACRTSAFLDDSFGLNFIMVRKFNLESDNPNADLVNLNNYIKNKIENLEELTLYKLLSIEELILYGLDNLKPIECFSNLKLVYLDHCKTQDLNLLNNIKEISFYETPEYPTNKPSLYYSAENFKGNITILNNPFEEVQKYFSRKSNSL